MLGIVLVVHLNGHIHFEMLSLPICVLQIKSVMLQNVFSNAFLVIKAVMLQDAMFSVRGLLIALSTNNENVKRITKTPHTRHASSD